MGVLTLHPMKEIRVIVAGEHRAFVTELLDRINATGNTCAIRDGLELATKTTNDFSEQHKFWVTSGHLRLGNQAYRATCTPAWF